jgi:hypothetical protein
MPAVGKQLLCGEKVVLVGEQNPYGSDPDFALYPAPDGCSGHRLCCVILGMRRADYLRSFERVNLCDGPWETKTARRRAESLRGRRVVMLGAKVARAFGAAYDPLMASRLRDVGTKQHFVHFLCLPHPSGRCRTWNEPGMVERARAAVAEFVGGGVRRLIGLTRVE